MSYNRERRGGPRGLVRGAGAGQIRMEHGRIDVVSEHNSAPVGVGVGEADVWERITGDIEQSRFWRASMSPLREYKVFSPHYVRSLRSTGAFCARDIPQRKIAP